MRWRRRCRFGRWFWFRSCFWGAYDNRRRDRYEAFLELGRIEGRVVFLEEGFFFFVIFAAENIIERRRFKRRLFGLSRNHIAGGEFKRRVCPLTRTRFGFLSCREQDALRSLPNCPHRSIWRQSLAKALASKVNIAFAVIQRRRNDWRDGVLVSGVSIAYAPGGAFRLAPLYDVISFLPYTPDRLEVDLAMTIGGEKRANQILPRHWGALAGLCRFSKERAVAHVGDLIARLPEAAASVRARCRDSGLKHPILDALTKKIHARCQALALTYGADALAQ